MFGPHANICYNLLIGPMMVRKITDKSNGRALACQLLGWASYFCEVFMVHQGRGGRRTSKYCLPGDMVYRSLLGRHCRQLQEIIWLFHQFTSY